MRHSSGWYTKQKAALLTCGVKIMQVLSIVAEVKMANRIAPEYLIAQKDLVFVILLIFLYSCSV